MYNCAHLRNVLHDYMKVIVYNQSVFKFEKSSLVTKFSTNHCDNYEMQTQLPTYIVYDYTQMSLAYTTDASTELFFT